MHPCVTKSVNDTYIIKKELTLPTITKLLVSRCINILHLSKNPRQGRSRRGSAVSYTRTKHQQDGGQGELLKTSLVACKQVCVPTSVVDHHHERLV